MSSLKRATEDVDNMAPVKHICSAIEHEICCYATIHEEEDNIIYNDLPGIFPDQNVHRYAWYFSVPFLEMK